MTDIVPRHHSTKPVSLSDQVYDHLRFAIISNELQPGAKLVELDIASQMGTSQGPVREALQRLERDGLVERRARSATFVTAVSIDEMFELFSIRRAIETFAIRRTALSATPEQCSYLDELVAKMAEAGTQREIVMLSEYDMRLHRQIIEWSGSTGLLRAWTPLYNQIQRFVVQSHPHYYPDLVEVGTRHQPIVDALRSHDVDSAVQAIQGHIMLIWSEIRP